MKVPQSASLSMPAAYQRRLRRPTARQIEAVYNAMRLLRDDRRTTGPDDKIWCAACRRSRERNGSASYSGHTLCNGCATDFEVLRLAGSVDRVEEFLASASAASASADSARRSGHRPAG